MVRSFLLVGDARAMVHVLLVPLELCVVRYRDVVGGVGGHQFAGAVRFVKPEIASDRQRSAEGQCYLSVLADEGFRPGCWCRDEYQLALARFQCELVVDRHDVIPRASGGWLLEVSAVRHARDAYGQVLILEVAVDVEDCAAGAPGVGDDIGQVPGAFLGRYGHGGSLDNVDPVCGALRGELLDRLAVGGVGLPYLYECERDSDDGDREGGARYPEIHPFPPRVQEFPEAACGHWLMVLGLLAELLRYAVKGFVDVVQILFPRLFPGLSHTSIVRDVQFRIQGGGAS